MYFSHYYWIRNRPKVLTQNFLYLDKNEFEGILIIILWEQDCFHTIWWYYKSCFRGPWQHWEWWRYWKWAIDWPLRWTLIFHQNFYFPYFWASPILALSWHPRWAPAGLGRSWFGPKTKFSHWVHKGRALPLFLSRSLLPCRCPKWCSRWAHRFPQFLIFEGRTSMSILLLKLSWGARPKGWSYRSWHW